jgi:hypothetical protein
MPANVASSASALFMTFAKLVATSLSLSLYPDNQMGVTATPALAGNSTAVEKTRRLGWQRVRNQIAASRQWGLVLWWYFALLLIAVVSKYLGTGSGDLGRTAHSGQAGWLHRVEHLIEVLPRLFRVYRADVLKASVIIALLFIFGHVVARIRVSLLAWISLSIATLVAFASWLAQHQTGVPLTYSTLMISINWGVQHPEVITSVLPLPAIGLVAVAALAYGSVPTVLTSYWAARSGRAQHGALHGRLRRGTPCAGPYDIGPTLSVVYTNHVASGGPRQVCNQHPRGAHVVQHQG